MNVEDYVRMVLTGPSIDARRNLLNNVPYHWREKVKARVIAEFKKKRRDRGHAQ